MTLAELITMVDATTQNSFSNQQKTDWVNRIESKIYTEVLMISESDFQPLVYATDSGNTLIVDDAHTDLYVYFLEQQIHYYHGENDRANNATFMFNEAFERYVRYIAFVYKPANFQDDETGLYYIREITKDIGELTYATASGVAVALFEVPVGYMINRCICVISEVFNSGTSDTIVLGTATDDDKFMEAGDIDATTIATYNTEPLYETPAATYLYAKNTQVGAAATTGVATFYIQYAKVQ